ncbi:MAG TPA: hypothetical protein VFU43_29415 [Streptosporangiaceae bacterium]|nr:hypothetical protein [Streptosporangiaceae bacterium]
MAEITDTQKFLLEVATGKDKADAQDRGPGQSRTPRVDMILDDINARNGR